MDSITLPHCWCCGVRFQDSTPPGPANKEVHHVIPRQAGGTDGPTVTICEKHHASLHKIALRLKTQKSYHDLLVGDTPECQQIVLWLATKVFNAFEAVKNDPNKKAMAMVTLDLQHVVMVERLKKVYPKARSREAILTLALEHFYRKHFTN